ncbi:MAG: DUF4234 domain-containing protein [Ruminococcus sp.]|nr:DUF4234 domain-containing protein [Ruminococcus sp.]
MNNKTLVTNRSLLKWILLGIITLGIYPIVAQCKMVHELNLAAYDRDGKIQLSPYEATPLFCITLYIYYFVYMHKYMGRLRDELQHRGISYSISPAEFWIFDVLLAITIICPFYFMHKVIKAHNLINADYNSKLGNA